MFTSARLPFRALIQKDKAITAMQEWIDVAELRRGYALHPGNDVSTQELLNQFATSTSIIEQCRIWREINKRQWRINPQSFDDISWKHTAMDEAGQLAEMTDFYKKYRRSRLFF